MIDHISHLAIAVPSIERAAQRLHELYGLSTGEHHVNERQGVRMAYVELGGGGRIELLEPLHEDSPVGRFLKRNPGGGFHHLSFAVADLDSAKQDLAQHGVRPVTPDSARNVHGERIAFLHPKDFLGVLVEFEEPEPAAGGVL